MSDINWKTVGVSAAITVLVVGGTLAFMYFEEETSGNSSSTAGSS